MPLRVNADVFLVLLLVQALAALLLVGVCAFLSTHRRRTYFHDWTLAVFCAVAWQLTAAVPPSSGVGPTLAAWLSCLFALWHAALWVLGVLRYRQARQAPPGSTPPGLWWSRADLLVPAGAALLAMPLALLVPDPPRRDGLLVLVGLASGAGAVGLAGRPAAATRLLAGVLVLDALGRFFAAGRPGALAAFPGLSADGVFGLLLDFVLLVLTVVAMIVVLLDEGEGELRDALGRFWGRRERSFADCLSSPPRPMPPEGERRGVSPPVRPLRTPAGLRRAARRGITRSGPINQLAASSRSRTLPCRPGAAA
jgi:hypothetical protein